MTTPESAREAEAARATKETTIEVRLRLGSRETRAATGVGFFDHLLTAASFHGRWGLAIDARGDLHVDYHHLVEDAGLVIGDAFRQLAAASPGIARFASAWAPMDEALAHVVVDVSGRGGAHVDPAIAAGATRDFDAGLAREFLIAFARSAGITLHARLLAGEDTHHRLEALFKALGMCLARAFEPADGGVPSTKGAL
ncbi:MAG TPA: imidazoleglycerol-phosphate dehydratase [Planctomycetota bacterium]|nr:imidazoleglycerol-phosphate dehydratase [Planctomycetota bacterium]OQC22235.1 MAG: Imidazoleglycerol-phosphate dehydratase [Planctomycetes bacterium ADurb.Bin069]NMD35281.1 imidazoleglycerol-phosphate dehydratase [Planctomycetota bacterium]HNS00594.1 imidazoleglycerol-phosphate dehydratase [Planctomycetota bacterium]HNU25930.1 imidazoleglycerol-phosphate dehydratase [Planctomycetota bacterium]